MGRLGFLVLAVVALLCWMAYRRLAPRYLGVKVPEIALPGAASSGKAEKSFFVFACSGPAGGILEKFGLAESGGIVSGYLTEEEGKQARAALLLLDAAYRKKAEDEDDKRRKEQAERSQPVFLPAPVEPPLPPPLPAPTPPPPSSGLVFFELESINGFTSVQVEMLKSNGLAVDVSGVIPRAYGMVTEQAAVALSTFAERLKGAAPAKAVRLDFVLMVAKQSKRAAIGLTGRVRFEPRSAVLPWQVDGKTGALVFSSAVFEATLRAESQKNRIEVLSRPGLLVRLGELSAIETGFEIPVQRNQIQQVGQGIINSVEFRPVVASIEAVVTGAGPGRYDVAIVQRSQEVAGQVDVGGGQVPQVATESLKTRIILVAGSWAVLGGQVVQRTGSGAALSGTSFLARETVRDAFYLAVGLDVNGHVAIPSVYCKPVK